MYYSDSGDGLAGLFITLCCCIISLPFFIAWVWLLIDAIKRDYPAGKENEKVVWILVLLFGSWIGALVYYIVVKKGYDKPQAVQYQTYNQPQQPAPETTYSSNVEPTVSEAKSSQYKK